MLTHWVDENTRFMGEDEPSRLDLILIKESGNIKEMKYKSPIRESDHVLIDYILQEEGRREK